MAVATLGPFSDVADVPHVTAEYAPLEAAVAVALPRARALLLQAALLLVVVVDGLPAGGRKPREDYAPFIIEACHDEPSWAFPPART